MLRLAFYFMKRLILLIGVVLFYTACSQNKTPDNLIEREKMLDVLVDIQLTDAYLGQVYNPDTSKMQAHSRYNYVFKKFGIDSAIFTNSLRYYSKNPAELDSMYSLVADSLKRLQTSLKPKPTEWEISDSLRLQSERINRYMFGKFKPNQPAPNKDSIAYNLDVKALFSNYKNSFDSLKLTKDVMSIIAADEKVIETENQPENDLPEE